MQTPCEPATRAELALNLLQQVKTDPVVVTPIIELLRDQTAIGRFIDPSIEESQFSTWLAVIRDLCKCNCLHQATDVALAWYDCINAHQAKNNCRYHKGGVAHQLGNCYLSRGAYACAAWFFTIAFIEDAVSGRKPEVSGSEATKALRLLFNWNKSYFDTIASTVQIVEKEKPDLYRYPETVIVELARQQKLVMRLAKSDEYIPTNSTFLKALIERLDETNTEAKGKALEFLASYLAISLPNTRIVPNASTPDHEMDLIVTQQSSSPTYLLEALGRSFLVECKNWKDSVGVEQVNHFVAKMQFHRCRCGVIFAPNNVSGGTPASLRNAKLTIFRWYSQDERAVIVITMSHLKKLVDGSLSFAEILLRGYESIRFTLPEDTIGGD